MNYKIVNANSIKIIVNHIEVFPTLLNRTIKVHPNLLRKINKLKPQ